VPSAKCQVQSFKVQMANLGTASDVFFDDWPGPLEKVDGRPTSTGESIPLIAFENEQFVVGAQALALLKDMPPPISVVTVAGLYRTGKSFLLNRVLLRRPGSGFSVSSTVNACTKGIWMWSEPVTTQDADGNTVQVLVVDTEGIGAPSADASHDTRVFSLGLLLSSYFVYNSSGSIDEQALSNLSLVTNISKEIRVSADVPEASDSGDGDGDRNTDAPAPIPVPDARYKEFFPAFLWVVRDFALQLEDPEGNEIGAEQYLENALDEGQGKNAESKNRIRRCLKQFFPSRGCVTLVRPCLDEKNLQRLDSLPDDALRPEFMRQARALRERVLAEAAERPLAMQGKQLSGSMLGFLCQAYSKAINEGGAPVIHDAWTYVCESQRHKAETDAVGGFINSGQALVDGHTCPSPPVFRDAINVLLEGTLDAYRETCVQLQSAEDPSAFVAAVKEKLLQEVEQLSRRNSDKYVHALASDVMRCCDVLGEAKPATFGEFREKFDAMYTRFTESHVEPASRLEARVRDPYVGVPDFEQGVRATWSQRMEPLVWRAVDTYYADAERARTKLQNELEEVRRETSASSQQHALEISRVREERETTMTNMRQEHDAVVLGLNEELESTRERLRSAEKRIEQLESDVVQAIRQSTEQAGKFEQQSSSHESRADSAEAHLTTMRHELEEMQGLQTSLERKEMALSTIIIERDSLNVQLTRVQSSLFEVTNEFEEVEKKYRAESRELNSKTQQSLDQMKKARKAEQHRSKKMYEAECCARERADSQSTAMQTEAETVRRQLGEAVEVHRQQVSLLQKQVEACDSRMAEKQTACAQAISEAEKRGRKQIEELEHKKASVKEQAIQKETEYARQLQEYETRAVNAEATLGNQKRRLEETEEILQRKRAKADDSNNSLKLVKAQAELEWLRRQTRDQETTLGQNATRIQQLSSELRETERSGDSARMILRLEYENRVAALEEELANK
jgi:hypothetical protein